MLLVWVDNVFGKQINIDITAIIKLSEAPTLKNIYVVFVFNEIPSTVPTWHIKPKELYKMVWNVLSFRMLYFVL